MLQRVTIKIKLPEKTRERTVKAAKFTHQRLVAPRTGDRGFERKLFG